MHFSVQLTRGAEYTGIGFRKNLDLPGSLLASRAAKALLLDARSEDDAESPDGYVVFDADGEWTERYRMVKEM